MQRHSRCPAGFVPTLFSVSRSKNSVMDMSSPVHTLPILMLSGVGRLAVCKFWAAFGCGCIDSRWTGDTPFCSGRSAYRCSNPINASILSGEGL